MCYHVCSMEHIRNFCIIAHIDHGKSTLADRFLEITKTIELRNMQEQVMDQMDLERERGITIKAKAVRLNFTSSDGRTYQLNLIDTPGHVDFTYEVSRSLAACDGAILVVDASQGVQAQTLANVYIAMEHNLTLIPVINKIDLPNAEPERVAQELVAVLGFDRKDILFVSAKDGKGVPDVLEAVVRRIPPPGGRTEAPLRALIFDSKYDSYKGVIAYVRVVDGSVVDGEKLLLVSAQKRLEAVEVGIFRPQPVSVGKLEMGEVGYIATGLKSVQDCEVGDTITAEAAPAAELLPGYRPVKPMVFAGLYPVEANDYPLLRDALEKLKLNDASLVYEAETSTALGFGFRCGFLGMLHMEIVRERLEREYGLSLVVTAPSVAFQVKKRDGTEVTVQSPAALPQPADIEEILEPWMDITVITPRRYIGAVMELVTGRGGEFSKLEYLGGGEGDSPWDRALMQYGIPLRAILVDFYDQLKSSTQGYASLDYTFCDYRPNRLVKLQVLVNNQPVDAFSRIVPVDEAQVQGRVLVDKLRRLIPRQLFDVPIQAAIGSKIIARETIVAMRKNVLAKCYGGDVTRKRKLLEKQAEGKKRLKRIGQVEVPQEAFLEVLKLR
ncbi:MAG: elongation factor 4 [Chloroflexi bacterium]|nr:elongation factor 4 [Chloroflexota bacterium]